MWENAEMGAKLHTDEMPSGGEREMMILVFQNVKGKKQQQPPSNILPSPMQISIPSLLHMMKSFEEEGGEEDEKCS